MHTPAFRYELNLNTVILCVTLVVTGAGWGIAYHALVQGRDNNAASISRLETRVATLETTGRVLDNHELRIVTVERQATEASSATRAVEHSINNLSADMRVIKEILERLERQQNGPRRPP